MRFIIFITILFLGLFGLAQSSEAATIYVDNTTASCSTPSDTDYNPTTETCGTGSSTVYNTINGGANAASAGDTVNVRAGTYSGSVTLTKSGTAGNYITLQPYTGETVYITTVPGAWYSIRGLDISYFKIFGFKIHNYTGEAIGFYGSGSHIEIRDNEIYDRQDAPQYTGNAIRVSATKFDGTYAYTISDVIIDGNYIHNTTSGANRYEGELLTVAFDVQRFQITNNILSDVHHIGIDCIGKTYNYKEPHQLINAYPNGGIISGNTLTNVGQYDEDSSIYIDGGKNITIEDNKIYDAKGVGITVSIEEVVGVTENIIVRRNQVVSSVRNLYVGAGNGTTINSRWIHNTTIMDDSLDYSNVGLLDGTGNIIKNNIFYSSGGNRQLEHGWNQTYTVALDYNDWYTGNMQFCYGGNSICYTNFTNYKTATGQDANSMSLDPKFTNISGNDITLQSDSPCIDAGDFLTKTTGSGTGTVIPVEDARYFHDGYGIAGVSGDTIKIGSNTATVTDIDYGANTITINKSISWNNGDGVSYSYSGSAPDIGAYEYISVDTTPPASPTGLTVN